MAKIYCWLLCALKKKKGILTEALSDQLVCVSLLHLSHENTEKNSFNLQKITKMLRQLCCVVVILSCKTQHLSKVCQRQIKTREKILSRF